MKRNFDPTTLEIYRALFTSVAEEMGVPPRSFEFQALYGMADPIKDALVTMGQRVRIYTPYGQLLPGMAYLVRRLLENTSNESFLRASFRDNVSPPSVETTIAITCVSNRQPLGNRGRDGRSMSREVSTSTSVIRPSRLK